MTARTLPPELFQLITAFAWNKPLSQSRLNTHLDCAVDIRENVPEWFLSPLITRVKEVDDNRVLVRHQNPLVAGNPFRPIDDLDLLYDRNVVLLLKHISRLYWRRCNMYEAKAWKLVAQPINVTWNELLFRLERLKTTDLVGDKCLVKVLLHTLVDSLPRAKLICRWKI